MAEQKETQNNPILNFEGKKYNLRSLSDTAKALIRASRMADNQMRLANENLELLKISSQAITSKLKIELKSQNPIEE